MLITLPLNRWVVKYAPIMAGAAKNKRKETSALWRVDETYIKVHCCPV